MNTLLGRKGRDRVFTLPNLITALRGASTLLFLFYAEAMESDDYLAALLVFALASDALDGYLAKSLDAETNLGEWLDPKMDAWVLSVATYVVYRYGDTYDAEFWVAIAIIAREVVVWFCRDSTVRWLIAAKDDFEKTKLVVYVVMTGLIPMRDTVVSEWFNSVQSIAIYDNVSWAFVVFGNFGIMTIATVILVKREMQAKSALLLRSGSTMPREAAE